MSDLGGVIARDPDVRQARVIAEAARRRLVACMSSPDGGIDPAEAQQMLDAYKDARTLAADAEDRVLLHRGLLTPAEADKRAVLRRPASPPRAQQARPAVRRGRRSGADLNLRVIAIALAFALLGVVGAALAQRGCRRLAGVRPPLARG